MGFQGAQPTPANGGDPLRICLLTYRGNPTCGGQGVYIKKISRALRDLGHHPHVVSGPPYPRLDDGIGLSRLPSLDLYNPEALFRVPTLRELRSTINLVEWASVSTGGFPEPFTFSLRALNHLRSRVGAFDVVHDNQCLSYGLLGIRRLGFPLVATIHHPITVDRRTEIEAERWPWRRWKVRRWYAFVGMQTHVSRRIPHVVTVSEQAKRDTALDFSIPLHRFRVIPNGIDTEIFHPLPDVRREPNRLIVTTSADTPIKGLRFLLMAVASLARKRDIRLTVVGTPKKEGGVEDLVRRLDLGPVLEFTGRIEDGAFAHYYARSTLAVVPSLYEGFGLPAGEAMACRIPVVSTTGGALPEVVGDAGVLVPPGDARALERAIETLLDDPEKRERLGRKGYERIQKHFTWESAARKLVKVYRESISANGHADGPRRRPG